MTSFEASWPVGGGPATCVGVHDSRVEVQGARLRGWSAGCRIEDCEIRDTG